MSTGLYRLVFDVQQHFVAMGISAGYPEITAVFHVRNGADAPRVQMSVAPYSYSTQLVLN